MTEKTLKQQNQLGLSLLLVANAVAFVVFLKAGAILSGSFSGLWADVETMATGSILPFLVIILNGLVPSDYKMRLVSMRWSHPYPGSRAFSELLHKDPRLDPDAIRGLVGDLPTDPAEQNRVWYRLYRPLNGVPEVDDVNRHFLFARDYTAFAVSFLIAAAPLGFWFMAWREAVAYSAVLVLQYLAASQAARTYGSRLVTTVLARAQP